ncbi:MAG: phospholipid carrier-dependent glycosyltransferase, partial [Clostridia bacterium]|nr:phospholipid carrier-dependent glycosyltransferase [Clostridia bacterium]
IVVAGVIALYWRKRDAGTLPFFGALMYIGLYAFGVMMHERYLFPVLLLLVFAYIQKPDWRVLLMLAGFSLTLFINCAVVLRDMHLQLGVGFLPGLISLCNILLAAVGVWIAVDRDSKPLLTPEREPADPTERLSALTAGAGKPARMTRLDILCMLALTAIYGVIAYTGLGDTKAPQTFWNSVPGETSTAVFDLGDTHDFTMLYYVGINSRSQDTFQVDFSADGEAWYGETLAKLYEGDCFKWLYLLPPVYDNLGEVAEWDERGPLVETARFIRIWREGPQATLFEVGFRDTDGKLLPVIAVSENGGVDAGLLIDEQDTVPEYPGYMNSAYFDEIYHARTGYEHLKGMRTFEWTHPPLGKVLIMFAVKLFGMTPFGWRFMGALMGVLMVPSMYLLGHLLFRRTRYAFMAAFVMAFDMMHLTQTRIATIDSYAVLCIILMYLFMFRYMRMSFFRDGKRSLWPLFFSGLFMGLGCASKWICFYAGLGLAALFFWSMAQRFAEWRAGLRAVDSLSDDVNRRLKRFPQLLLGTFAACIVFFIVIPCAIYYASYIPHMAYEGGLSFAGFWREQVRMFGYHANLLAGHSYQSPWYEWPLILRPMWYYRGLYGIAEGNVSSIVAMGNPVVWWVGCSTMVYLLWSWLKPHLYGRRVRDHRPALLLISFLAQLVPWLFVTRAIFIYHYFGSLPFVMLSIVYALERFGIKNRRAELSVMFGYLAIVAAMFVGFYPIATGSEVSRRWMDAVNWLKNIKLPGWTFGGWLRY